MDDYFSALNDIQARKRQLTSEIKVLNDEQRRIETDIFLDWCRNATAHSEVNSKVFKKIYAKIIKS